ncbi:MAG: GNAT family N-acetyltransferase [Synergistaceae bacterium]|nr:GNAT family N-acetyltransferase [Synergistaceae bacterium]
MIWNELKFFLTRLKGLNVSKSITLGEGGGFCVSTGCDIESWVWYPGRVVDSETVERAKEFFRDNKISFMWPVYDGGEKILEDCGLLYAGSLTAMSYEPGNSSDTRDLDDDPVNPKEWAETAWHGFGGEADDVPANYYKLVESFNADPAFTLHAHKTEGRYDGTFMLAEEESVVGVYYVATVPEMRRRGVATSMLSRICALARGRTLVLQATPTGLPLYKKFGFKELFKIPVYSDVSEVF